MATYYHDVVLNRVSLPEVHTTSRSKFFVRTVRHYFVQTKDTDCFWSKTPGKLCPANAPVWNRSTIAVLRVYRTEISDSVYTLVGGGHLRHNMIWSMLHSNIFVRHRLPGLLTSAVLFCVITAGWFIKSAHVVCSLAVQFDTAVYTVSQKRKPPNFGQLLCQILTDFKNSFTSRLSRKFAIQRYVVILPHITYVATLPCETWSTEK